jgi:hypothetical protein
VGEGEGEGESTARVTMSARRCQADRRGLMAVID